MEIGKQIQSEGVSSRRKHFPDHSTGGRRLTALDHLESSLSPVFLVYKPLVVATNRVPPQNSQRPGCDQRDGQMGPIGEFPGKSRVVWLTSVTRGHRTRPESRRGFATFGNCRRGHPAPTGHRAQLGRRWSAWSAWSTTFPHYSRWDSSTNLRSVPVGPPYKWEVTSDQIL